VAPIDQVLAALARRSFAPTPWRRGTPWGLERQGDTIELRLAEAREERLADPANRELVVACGALVETMRIVAGGLGYALEVEHVSRDDDGLIARARIDTCITNRREDATLLRQIAAADDVRTPRRAGRFSPAFSPALMAVLRHAARSGGAWLDVIVDDARRQLLADLELEAGKIADAQRSARRLVAMNAPKRRSEGTLFVEGGSARLGELLSMLGARITIGLEWNGGRASHVRSAAVDAPLLAVLGTHGDSTREWLNAGRALQRVLLHASEQGLRATFLNEPLDHPLIRDALRNVLFADGAPHAIIRFEFEGVGANDIDMM
jgi:hypothetical protein